MSDTKFTPGPWKIIASYMQGSNGERVRFYGDGLAIAMTRDTLATYNYALLLAAPELYAALEFAQSELARVGLPVNHPVYVKMAGAMAKARGEA